MFYRETDFKDEQLIGEIPKNWESIKLEEVVEIHDSKRIPLSEMERKNRKGQYPYCGANGIIDYIDNYIFDGEFVLLAEDGGSYGRLENTAYIMNGKFWVNNHAHILRAIEGKTSNLFLKYALDFLDLNPYVVGSTRKKLNQEQMREIRIPLPPFEEQRGIVGVLGVVDSVIAKTGEVIAKTERLKKGLMQTLLTRGIGHKEYKQTPIGTIPKEWEIIRLKDKAWVKEGVYGKRGEKGVIQLKADSISDSGRINANAYALISVDRQIDDYLLEPGDIILSNRNSAALVGKCAIFRGEFKQCVFSNLLTRIRLNSKDVLPEWLLYILMKIKDDGLLRAFSTRAVNQVLLKKELVENLKVPLPSISEQQEIVNILSAIDDKLELEKEEKAKLERIKQGLMDLLLTGKIRVKVD